jgi:hypothetical protein
MQLSEVLAAVTGLPPESRAQLTEKVLAAKARAGRIFTPNTGPQTEGYFCEADVMLFGGNPGGGKTALEIGLALNSHYRSLIVRKNFTDLEGLIDTAKKIVGTEDGFIGGSRPKYRKTDGGVIHFAGLGDGGLGGHQGVDHDLICFDEAAQFPESPVRLMMGWLRTERPGQRCRVIMASNPPLDSTGDWMIDYFGPWLNENHPNPAKPGELRYFLPDKDGKDCECQHGDWTMIAGEKVYAQSRSFIPSRFTDNPFYDPQKYATTLASVPEEFRERLISGNFMLARHDQPHQTIPTEWIRLAQKRWKPKPPEGVPMCTIGVDASGGGTDPLILAPRYDGWYATLIEVPGREIPADRIGPFCAGLVVSHRRDEALVVIDMGGGYGGSTHDHLKANAVDVSQYKGAEGTTRRSRDGKMHFTNVRSAAYWLFREALDPAQAGGSPIALPADPVLVADLTAPTFEPTPHGIKVEPKEKVCERLKRSTDRGDAVVMAWWSGAKMPSHYHEWRADQRTNRNAPLKVNMGSRRKARG